MIGQLITTLIMAIGIATGNVSSNAYKGGNVLNTSQNNTKPTTKRATDTINDTYNMWGVSEFDTPGVGEVGWTDNAKYLPLININGELITTANISTSLYNIYTTTYTTKTQYQNSAIIMEMISLYKITTYFNFNATTFTITQVSRFDSSTTASLNAYVLNYITNYDISDYIDMTYNANTRDDLQDKINNVWNRAYPEESRIFYENFTSVNKSYNNDYTVQSIQESTTLYIVMRTSYQLWGTPSNIDGTLAPNDLIITGTATTPTVNYEIIDIPNLMFTIITLPFSFISNAFNLTIFPNTPYQLNFTNLFMTILAAFILTWIIRKVFK